MRSIYTWILEPRGNLKSPMQLSFPAHRGLEDQWRKAYLEWNLKLATCELGQIENSPENPPREPIKLISHLYESQEDRICGGFSLSGIIEWYSSKFCYPWNFIDI